MIGTNRWEITLKRMIKRGKWKEGNHTLHVKYMLLEFNRISSHFLGTKSRN